MDRLRIRSAEDSLPWQLPTLVAVRVVGVAAVMAVGVVVGGFALQWLGLPRAGGGDVVAARATLWLGRYRETSSNLLIGDRHVHATCVRGWIDDLRGRDRRGTLLRLATGGTIRDFPPHTLVVRGVPVRQPVALLQAAGCTKVLADRLATLSQFDGGVRATRIDLNGVRALVVRFPRLTLYVNRSTGRPIGVSNPWLHGTFRLIPLLHPRGSP
jgi:hypothetical protein